MGLNDKITSLQDDQKVTVDSYIELHPMHNRMQGSLIPIIGKGLNYLFRIAIQLDLTKILVNVDKIQRIKRK